MKNYNVTFARLYHYTVSAETAEAAVDKACRDSYRLDNEGQHEPMSYDAIHVKEIQEIDCTACPYHDRCIGASPALAGKLAPHSCKAYMEQRPKVLFTENTAGCE